MSDISKINKKQTDSQQISNQPINTWPKIMVVNMGELGVPQDYSNIQIINRDSENIYQKVNPTPPEFFNSVIKHVAQNSLESQPFYLFLSQEYEFAHKNVLSQMVDILIKNPQYNGVYTDNSALNFPAFHQDVFQHQLIINTPMLFSPVCDVYFDTTIKHLFFYQVLSELKQRFMFYHIATPVFTVARQNTQADTMTNIANDLQLINKTLANSS